MKICILTPRFPFPENGGDVLRINSIARYLKSKNYELVLISFCNGEIKLKKEYFDLYDTIYIVKHSKIFSYVFAFLSFLQGKPLQCGFYFSPIFKKQVFRTDKIENPDKFIAHLLRTVPYLEKKSLQQKTIVEMTDSLSKTYSLSKKAKGFSFKKIIYFIEKKLIQNYEKKVIKSFPKIVLVSENDIEFLKQQNKIEGKNLVCHTNGVSFLPQISTSYDKNRICFVGNMRTLQNQDAVFFFVKKIFPLVKKEIPQATFYIIGAEPSEQIKALADNKNIFVTGFVDDIQKEVSSSCVAVAPVRIAAGIQNKVLISMGCGVPLVMSSLISKAIPELKNNVNCIIEDDAKKIAENITILIKNSSFRNLLAQNAYETVKNNYSWNAKLEGYELSVELEKNKWGGVALNSNFINSKTQYIFSNKKSTEYSFRLAA